MCSNNYLIPSIKYLFCKDGTVTRESRSHPSPPLRAGLRANGRVGQAHLHLSLGHFPLGRPWLKDERRRNLAILKSKSESDTTKAILKTRKGVGWAGWSSPAETRWSWGKDSFLPPNSLLPSPPLRRAEMARISRKPRHLGASSPSGNVRGECRGWTP